MIVAHALGGVRDLPVPGELFLYGGAIVLGLSFLALGFLWPEPRLEEAAAGRPLPDPLQRILFSRALRIVLGALATGLLTLVVAAGLFGSATINLNLAPTVVWVLFWLGFVPIALLIGNVWTVLSPLRAVADAVAWLSRGTQWQPMPYPERLGRWPAAALFSCVAAMELVYATPADPRAVAAAVVVYAGITWGGMLIFGRRAWLANGETFHVYFGLFALMSPFAVSRSEGKRVIVVRSPFVGLAGFRGGPGDLALVAAMLGSVGFDSITRTSFWQNFQTGSLTSDSIRVPVMLAVLAGVIGFVALAYRVAIAFAHRATGASFPLGPLFLASLIPIAFVYSIAHYISLLLSQGQFAIPLASDPFGKGWNLLGTADFAPNLVPLSPHELWYVQVGTLVAGHVVGLTVAHDRSVRLFEGAASLRSQYAMLLLMVLYTCGGLYLLSSP